MHFDNGIHIHQVHSCAGRKPGRMKVRQPDHAGIVEKVENGYVYTIEGNSGDRVVENAWCIGYYEILGYGVPLYNN